jgi:hypothetical protein
MCGYRSSSSYGHRLIWFLDLIASSEDDVLEARLRIDKVSATSSIWIYEKSLNNVHVVCTIR